MLENLRVSFGRNYRYLREYKGYSQDKVAEGSELSLSYLSLIEQGKANPPHLRHPRPHAHPCHGQGSE